MAVDGDDTVEAPAAAAAPPPSFLHPAALLPAQLVIDLFSILRHEALAGDPCCIYTPDGVEREALLCLLSHAAAQTGAASRPIASMAQELLFCCVADGAGRGLPPSEHAAPPDGALEADAPRCCALSREIARLVEIPSLGSASHAETVMSLAPLAFPLNGAPAAGNAPPRSLAAAALLGRYADWGAPAIHTTDGGAAALEAAVAGCEPEAIFRDWSLRLSCGSRRAAELLARRARATVLTLAGLRALLTQAGGVGAFAPAEAPTWRGGYPFAPIASPLMSRLVVFKRMEARAAAASLRAERESPAAARVASGKAILVEILSKVEIL